MSQLLQEDIEKTSASKTDKSSSSPSPIRRPSNGFDKESQMRRGSVTKHHEGFFSAFTLESFKRNPNARVVTEATDLEGRPLPDQPPAEPALAMSLKERHLQMIAIGGSIGSLIPIFPPRHAAFSKHHVKLTQIALQVRDYSSDLALPSQQAVLHPSSSLMA